MRHILTALLACLPVAGAVAQATQPAEPEVGDRIRLGFAGIQLALPPAFGIWPVDFDSPFDVVRSARVENNKPVLSVHLTAYPNKEEVTLDQFVEAAGLKPESAPDPSRLAIRNVKVLKTAALRIGGQDGQVRVISYNFRGIDTTAVQVFFQRSWPDLKIKMGYRLTIEAERKRGKELIPTLAAIAETVELFDPVSPASEKIELLEPALPNDRYGYSIRPVKWWKLSASPTGDLVRMGQTDYCLGQRLPVATLQVVPTKGTAKQAVEDRMVLLNQELQKLDRQLKVLREGEVVLGGQPGYEIVATTEPVPGKTQVGGFLAAQRCIVHEGLSYSLTLMFQEGQMEAMDKTMGIIASGFSLKSATGSAPASGPALGTLPLPPAPPATAPAPVAPPVLPPEPPTTVPSVGPPVAPATTPAATTRSTQEELRSLEELLELPGTPAEKK